MNREELLMKALEIAVKDINRLWDKLNNGLYIPYYTNDYIEAAQSELLSKEE